MTLRDVASGGDDYARIAYAGGQANAESHLRSGYGLADDLAGIGQQIGGYFQQKAIAQEQSKRSKAIDDLFSGEEMPDPKSILRVMGPKDGLAVIQGLNAIHPQAKSTYKDRMEQFRDAARGIKALPADKQAAGWDFATKSLVQGGVLKAEEVVPFNPDTLEQIANYGVQPKGPTAPISVKPGETLIDPTTHQPVYSAPAAQKEPTPFNLGPGDVRYDGQGNIIAQRAPAPPQESKTKLWVMRDGQPLRVSESEVRPGDKPASTREQGRPVTSGDAGRIADFDTSLDDLNKLAESIGGSKATGTMAKIGAGVWNPITEVTGFGTEAKAKQATIDRVKQVIGKALEGGVLRKEDEAKYERILPTIGDPPDVVKAKLDGLWKAIQQRKQTQIEALADAGYDVTKFSARAPRERAQPAAAGGSMKITSKEQMDALPSGTRFVAPDGSVRIKP